MEEAKASGSILSRPASEFVNDELVEELWAAKAIEHAETYFNIITCVEPRTLRLTPFDDDIYRVFREHFPDLRIKVLTDDLLKSPEAKIRWRLYAEMFTHIEDHSFGTLMRADCTKDFSAENSVLVVRIQFLAIEIARNREGLNDFVFELYRLPPRDIGLPTWRDEERYIECLDSNAGVYRKAP